MYKIKTNKQNKLIAIGTYGEETIHMVHCSETIEDLIYENLYIVAEECTNFARVHLVSDFSQDEALQQIDDYLKEVEGVEESHLIGVFNASVR
jgi:ferredoxin-NADP reductase